MSKKKHTHQTKAEEHAEAEAEAAAPGVVLEGVPVDDEKSAAPATRLQRLLERARTVAKKRLAGTRAEQLLEQLPGRVEKLLDNALDRVGLVRKSTLPKPA
jgi:hypothetical protein